MTLIREIVEESLASGCLTVQAEDQLRQLLSSKYDVHDFRAFMLLQQAVVSGHIRQESREKALHNRSLAVAS